MKVLEIKKYLTPFGEIEFLPCRRMPGFSYEVIIDRVRRNDLFLKSGQIPNKKTAVYFARLIAGEKEKGDKYFYTDKNIDPPSTQQWFHDLCEKSLK